MEDVDRHDLTHGAASKQIAHLEEIGEDRIEISSGG